MRIVLAVAVAAALPARLLAHEGEAAEPSAWDVLALAALGVTALLYAIGSWRMRQRGARVRAIERLAFWAGWCATVAAIAPPMDRAAASAFSSHMAQHELLMVVGAPLMIVGRPVVPWLWALPSTWRSGAAAGLQARAAGAAWRALTRPVVAWAAHGATLWVWHAPVFYQAAVRSEAIHAFQHATFVGTSVLFWWGLVYGRYGRAAYGASVLYVFTTMVHTGILGALFALSREPFYEVYRARAAAGGFDAATDQQLAGLYMWVPAGIVLTVFGLALLLAWLSEAERRGAYTTR